MTYRYVNSSIKNYSLWIAAWFGFVLLYVFTMKSGLNAKDWDSVIYIVQLLTDILIGIFSYLAFRKQDEFITKRFYLLIFISLIPGLLTNEIYNVLINIFRFNQINGQVNIWSITYIIYQMIQIYAWSYLLFHKKELESKKSRWLVKLPYLQCALIVGGSLISLAIFRTTFLTEIGLQGLCNSILETILFILISICLSRTRNLSLIFLEMGFLLLIAFNLAHRFSYSTGNHFKTFDAAWLLSLITIIFGLVQVHKTREKIEFFDRNSIHTIAGSIFLLFATILLGVFILVDFMVTSIELSKLRMSTILPQNIPSILIFSFSISLLLSKIVANYISRPLEKISSRVDLVLHNEKKVNKLLNENFQIYEIDKLDKFIIKIVSDLHNANKIKSEFLMHMSHDFRTPASGIYNLAKTIYKKIDNPSLKELQKYVVDSSGRLLTILDEVLNYTNIDSGKSSLKLEKFNLNNLIDEIVSLVSAKVQEKNLTLNVNHLSNKFFYVNDQQSVRKILLNLISNAIKFTNKGFITVSVNYEVLDIKQWLVIKIEDTGIGIDEKYHQLIFQPFTRVESPETGKYDGIGLGLSNVNLLVKKLNGKISVKSKIGVGSVFIVSLPVI